MREQAKGVVDYTPKTGSKSFTHAGNQRLLAERFRFIDASVRLMMLNFIEDNARHYYKLAGGSEKDFEQIFNQEKHANNE